MNHNMNNDDTGNPGTRTFPFGTGDTGEPVQLSEQQISTHTMIFGAQSSGLTAATQMMAAGLLELGWDGLILDLKADIRTDGLGDWLRDHATQHDIAFQELRLPATAATTFFDALAALDSDGGRDVIMSLATYDDNYYEKVAKGALTQLLELMHAAHQAAPNTFAPPTLASVAAILSAPHITSAAQPLLDALPPRAYGERPRYPAIVNPGLHEQQQTLSWGARLNALLASPTVMSTLTAAPQRQPFHIDDTTLTYIGLDVHENRDVTRLVSSTVLQQLSTPSQRQALRERPLFVVVNGADLVDHHILRDALARARSGGIAMILVTAGPQDWTGGPSDFAQISRNVNVTVVTAQNAPDTAELCAQHLAWLAPVAGFDAGSDTVGPISAQQLLDLGDRDAYVRAIGPIPTMTHTTLHA